MGIFSCCSTSKRKVTTTTTAPRKGSPPLGVSVHWLKTGFIDEIKAYGLSERSNIYQIEDLRNITKNGVIRSKGEDIICPHDGRIGAAYVDCLEGEENVGPATIMLSYGWRYEVKDIVDTLDEYCHSEGLDVKSTYIWICCLCVNQHRVVESKKLDQKSGEVNFEKFQHLFHDRVTRIGHVVALMCPWDGPVYLTRIWCIFELYIASQTEKCHLTIAMPPREKQNMVTSLRREAGIDELYKNLSATKVENAEASEELDRVRILEMVRNGPGYNELNRVVNMLLRDWVKVGLLEAVRDYERKFDGDEDQLSVDTEYAKLCNDIGKVMRDQGELDEASKLQEKAVSIFEKNDEQGTLNDVCRRTLADSYNNLGLLQKKLGNYEESKYTFQKALKEGKTVWEENDYDAAQTYNNIGLALDDMGQFDEALEAYEEAQKIVEACLGNNHPNVAGAISNIAYLLEKMGRRDEAIAKMKQVIEIDERSNGLDHPDTANSYNILGVILTEKGDYDQALVQYRKALAVREKVFGKESTLTATSYHNIGSVLYDLGKYEEALVDLQKAFDIYASSVGEDHPECKVTQSYINLVKAKML